MREVRLFVKVPNVPDDWSDEDVRDWLRDSIDHPFDAAYEAFVEVSLAPHPIPPFGTLVANPDRVNNGTMAYKTNQAGD